MPHHQRLNGRQGDHQSYGDSQKGEERMQPKTSRCPEKMRRRREVLRKDRKDIRSGAKPALGSASPAPACHAGLLPATRSSLAHSPVSSDSTYSSGSGFSPHGLPPNVLVTQASTVCKTDNAKQAPPRCLPVLLPASFGVSFSVFQEDQACFSDQTTCLVRTPRVSLL